MEAIKTILWRLPKFLLVPIMKFRFRHHFTRKVKLEREGCLIKIKEEVPELTSIRQIYVFHPLRVTRYFMGIQERLNHLGGEYCLDQIKDLNPGVIVDIGSNVGEFTLVANQMFPSSQFIRFEPSRSDNFASKRNLVGVNEILVEKALWKTPTKMKFYDRNATGDSSLIKSDQGEKFTLIETTTLDIEMSRLEVESIELLKLEAEGAEPEILEGAANAIKMSKYITADLGPERGISQVRTFDAVNKILTKSGFELVAENSSGRECYLYRRI